MQKTISIIGLGSFGVFTAKTLVRHGFRVIGYSRKVPEVLSSGIIQTTNLDKAVTAADIIILCVPLQAYNTILPVINKKLRSRTLVVDVCSVKINPEKLFEKYLPSHKNILLTHPLFGPQSAANGTAGHTMIVTKKQGLLANKVLQFGQDTLGLSVKMMSSDEHDRIMAQVQALSFFIARGLHTMNLPNPAFMTPSYQSLINLIALDAAQSQELYDTVQRGNPYATKMNKNFVEQLKATLENY